MNYASFIIGTSNIMYTLTVYILPRQVGELSDLEKLGLLRCM